MHTSGHFNRLEPLKSSQKPTHYKRAVEKMLDVLALEPLDAGGLLTVAWRSEADENVGAFTPDSPYHGDVVRLTIPSLCHRIPDLTQYPDLDNRGGYGKQLVTPDDPSSESGSLYLFVEAQDTTSKALAPLTLDTAHFCDSNKQLKYRSIHGRMCAIPIRSKAGLRRADGTSDYIAIVWDWERAYEVSQSDTDKQRKKKQGVIETIKMAPITDSPVCLVSMLIPGGTLVWVPITSKAVAERAHRQLTDAATYPMYELDKPFFIDGPDIFVATCTDFAITE